MDDKKTKIKTDDTIIGTSSNVRKINRDILYYANSSLINTDEISDGKNTFGELYERIFKLEQKLALYENL